MAKHEKFKKQQLPHTDPSSALYSRTRMELLGHNFVVNKLISDVLRGEESYPDTGDDPKPIDQVVKSKKGTLLITYKRRRLSKNNLRKEIYRLIDAHFVEIGRIKLTAVKSGTPVLSGQSRPKNRIFIESNPVRVVDHPKHPITDFGIYVRHHPRLRQSDWIKLYSEAKKELMRRRALRSAVSNNSDDEWLELYPELRELYPEVSDEVLAQSRQRPKSHYDLKTAKKIYIGIESKIPKWWRKKHGKGKTYTGEDTHYTIIKDAIADYLGTLDIDDDKLWMELNKKYRDSYYETARKYQLPTIRDYPSLFQTCLTKVGT
jgi:hypothetical protein